MREKLLEVLEKEFDALDIMTIYHKMDLSTDICYNTDEPWKH